MDQTTSVGFPEAPPPEAQRPPLWLRLPFLPGTIRGWLYLALVLAAIPVIFFMLFGPNSNNGKILFGTSIDASTHELSGVTSSFTVGDTWAFRGELTESAQGNSLVIQFTQTTPDGTVYAPIQQPGPDTGNLGVVYSPQAIRLTGAEVGSWKVEVLRNSLRGNTVLATGEFTVSAAPGTSPSGPSGSGALAPGASASGS